MAAMAEPKEPRKLTVRTAAFEDQEARASRAKAEREARDEAERKRAQFEMKVRVTEHLTGRLPRDGLAPVFFAAARRVAMEVLLGNIPIRNGSDAGAAINALMAAGRIEAAGGAADDDAVRNPPATPEEARKRLAILQDTAAKRRAELGEASGE